MSIVDLVINGGIAGIDIGVIIILYRQSKFYLKYTPHERDYSFVSKKHLVGRINEEIRRYRELGKWLYKLIPLVLIISLFIVATTIVITRVYVPKTDHAETSQAIMTSQVNIGQEKDGED